MFLKRRVVVLLVSGGVSALVLAVIAGTIFRRASVQREAVAKLRGLGAVVSYDFQYPSPLPDDFYVKIDGSTAWVKAFAQKDTTDLDADGHSWLRTIFGPDAFNDVASVRFTHYGMPENPGIRKSTDYREIPSIYHLEPLRYLSQIRYLGIGGDQATKKTLEAIRDLRQLRVLLISDARLENEDLSFLENFQELRELYVGNSGLTDAALAHIGQLTRLERLTLQENRFTDQGIVHLRDLRSLKAVALGMGRTRITGSGLVHLNALKKLEEISLELRLLGRGRRAHQVSPRDQAAGSWPMRPVARGGAGTQRLATDSGARFESTSPLRLGRAGLEFFTRRPARSSLSKPNGAFAATVRTRLMSQSSTPSIFCSGTRWTVNTSRPFPGSASGLKGTTSTTPPPSSAGSTVARFRSVRIS